MIPVLVLALAGVCFIALSGCMSSPQPSPAIFTNKAFAATDAKKAKASPETIARFKKYNQDLSSVNISNNTKTIYAPDLYFQDPFKELQGEQPFEDYLLRGSAATAQFSLEFKDIGESEGTYYFNWIMTVKLHRDKKKAPPTQTPGISQVRFGADGKVIFQHDFYDAGGFLYEKLPILGGGIRFVKKHM
jgi:hypothetical protein